MKKLGLFAVFTMLFITLACEPEKPKTITLPSSAVPSIVLVKCDAGADEICPSDQFRYDAQRIKQLDQQITTQSNSDAVRAWRDSIDLRNGIADRMNPQIAQQTRNGYKYDDSLGKFKKMTPDEWKAYMQQNFPQSAPMTPAKPAPTKGQAPVPNKGP